MKLNLINKEISEIKYDVTRFPDGEPQFFLTEELNRKESIDVICRISNTEDLFLLVQVGDILDRQEVEWDLHITYLMSMRMDRVMSFNRPFSLKVVCNMLNSLGYRNIYVLEAHSSRTFHLLGDRCLPWEFGHHSWIPAQSNIVFPDHGRRTDMEVTILTMVI
jgi:phosphoribosylpyrophosphate synthetase